MNVTDSSSSSISSSHDYSSIISSNYTIHVRDNVLAIAGCMAVTLQLLRISIYWIQKASAMSDVSSSSTRSSSTNDKKPTTTSYGSVPTSGTNPTTTTTTNQEGQPLLLSTAIPSSSQATDFSSIHLPRISLLLHIVLTVLFGTMPIFQANASSASAFPVNLCYTTSLVLVLGIGYSVFDFQRTKFGFFNRFFSIVTSLLLFVTFLFFQYVSMYEDNNDKTKNTYDTTLLLSSAIYFGLSLVDGCVYQNPNNLPKNNAVDDDNEDPDKENPPPPRKTNTRAHTQKKKFLSGRALAILLKPYFWPNETELSSATVNRLRAILTWVCVILSKVCNLGSPLFLGWASTSLAHAEYIQCIYYSILYNVIQFLGSFFKESQSLVYLKVAQAAYIELSITTFEHIHNLSLDWHMNKKLGEVIRSMDRGINACDTLMKYLFLWLLPAFLECTVVCIIFAFYFHYIPLSITVFYFIYIYVIVTILVTLWRKKFRKQVTKSDNEWHDICTDSLINFETVKYFTAEQFEKERFQHSIAQYQASTVHVQASLSLLNISQRFLMQICLAAALSLSALGIQKRSDCCLAVGLCESVVSDCCRNIPTTVCPGMEVGDFVAVLTYTLNLFQPLNFLGSVYNAIVMAFVDLHNLSELLAEDPDITDLPNAIPLPDDPPKKKKKNNNDDDDDDDDDVAIEFDNVYFHYPTQPSTKGLKGLSFKMKRGTTTAIVGPTGAGKTTISRLLFRFYDIHQGSIKVNGYDIRDITQKSLREKIGVVPQSAIMFNDTIRFNLLYGNRNATEEQLVQAAKDAQLLEFIESLTDTNNHNDTTTTTSSSSSSINKSKNDKWNTIVGDRGLKLSGGEKQRAAIARCLLKDPPFVVLDEATSSLDTITEASVQEALDRLGNKRTCLVIAHRLGTIRNADNIIVVKDGIVHEQGTHDELLSKPNGVYADLWNIQLHNSSSGGSNSASRNNLLLS